jgi:integrase
MSISSYKNNEKILYKVYVHVRSKHNRKVRLQKTAFAIETEPEAKKIEKKLYKEAVEEISKRDGLGFDWGDVVHHWIQSANSNHLGKKISARTIVDYTSALTSWTKHWFDRPAARISSADGREVFFLMEEEDRARTHQIKVKRIIHQVYNWGIENRLIIDSLQNPVAFVQIDKGEEKIPQILNKDEITFFLKKAKEFNHEWYPVWYLALHTGMRNGELYGLKWNAVDFDKKLIYVHLNFCSNTKTLGPTKGRYWRVVPISPRLEKLLLELKAQSNDEFVLPRLRDWYFGNQAQYLKEFLRDIGVKEIVFHALRACWATQMLANGVPSATVMKVGGWKKLSTMDIYLRLAGVDVKGATDSLDFSSPDTTTMKTCSLDLFVA